MDIPPEDYRMTAVVLKHRVMQKEEKLRHPTICGWIVYRVKATSAQAKMQRVAEKADSVPTPSPHLWICSTGDSGKSRMRRAFFVTLCVSFGSKATLLRGSRLA